MYKWGAVNPRKERGAVVWGGAGWRVVAVKVIWGDRCGRVIQSLKKE